MTTLTPRRAALQARHLHALGRHDEAQLLEDYVARHAAQHCRICGRRLTHPISLARGIGPECWANQPPPEAA
jgi:hypothetical protein